jgi:hypothetical protein
MHDGMNGMIGTSMVVVLLLSCYGYSRTQSGQCTTIDVSYVQDCYWRASSGTFSIGVCSSLMLTPSDLC